MYLARYLHTSGQGVESNRINQLILHVRSRDMQHQWSIADFYVGTTLGEGHYGRVVHAIVKNRDEKNETSPTKRRPRIRITDISTGKTDDPHAHHCYCHAAIKIMDKAQLIRLKQTRAALRERKILTYLTEILDDGEYKREPFVPRLLMSFADESSLYIVSELCDGGTLADLFRHANSDAQSLSNHEERNQWARHISAQIVCGLEFLHSMRIIHRDLKPDMVLLLSSGSVKLTDFGTAIQVQSDNMEEEIDGMSGFVGTADFVSPEMIRGTRDPTNARAPFSMLTAQDLWSFGCILHFLLSGDGTSPFHAESDAMAMAAVLAHADGSHTVPLSSRIPLDGKELIGALLTGKPEMRLGCGDIVWQQPDNDGKTASEAQCDAATDKLHNTLPPLQHYKSIRNHQFFFDTNWNKIDEGTDTPPRAPSTPTWVEQYETGISDLRDGASIHNDLSWHS